ncbi:MAG: hypothetical protein RL757_2765 [Bacteroidota bacterium]|jgi:hypothetical protein
METEFDFATIDLSPIKNEFNKIVFGVFRAWVADVKIRYPKKDIVLKNETELLNAARTVFQKEIGSISGYRNCLEFCTSEKFFDSTANHIITDLRSEWRFDYIVKQTKTYKKLLAYDVLYNYFDDNPIALMNLDAEYDELFQSRVNFSNVDSLMKVKMYEDTEDYIDWDIVKKKGRIKLMLEKKHNKLRRKVLDLDDKCFKVGETLDFYQYLPREKFAELMEHNINLIKSGKI